MTDNQKTLLATCVFIMCCFTYPAFKLMGF